MRSTGLDRRDQLRRDVDEILASERNGAITRVTETSSIDFKEEAGRRNGPDLEPGSEQNPTAAVKLADEVACMANSPGGGALILGVEDGTGVVLGTELNTDWLRRRIHQAIDIAPDIEARHVGASASSSCTWPSRANRCRTPRAACGGAWVTPVHRWTAPSGGSTASGPRTTTPWRIAPPSPPAP